MCLWLWVDLWQQLNLGLWQGLVAATESVAVARAWDNNWIWGCGKGLWQQLDLWLWQGLVASGLVPRWGAKQPQFSHCILTDRTCQQVLGLLRTPTRGKPAHHN